MKIAIRTHDVTLTEALRALVTRRLSSAFDRLGPTVRAIDVTLSDVNGPRGGVDKHCRLRVHSDTAAPVVVVAVAAELEAAITAAAERAARVVVRTRVRQRGFAPLEAAS
ncbi:MAG: HPF/RaiA family ribosome-associated protein [Kofleriaceae bacterium]|jgi:putative sigma-54 modulation protein|nr:HPF/RaiA family ribosome-associated protein [Kofleriaceae bacterium]MBP9171015.1 HPF/RaiA family ribosome-associated protein [Kofleriaceae bacterium]MBP9860656.1 HPF/RaiA family ribosome-associated protein [Kofleriaceae bacterium]